MKQIYLRNSRIDVKQIFALTLFIAAAWQVDVLVTILPVTCRT